MKKKRHLIILIPLIIIVGIIVSTIIAPAFYVKLSLLYKSKKVGLTLKQDENVSFYENEGDKHTLILLYPNGDNKDGFINLVQYLSSKYHLIIPDIPYKKDDTYNSIFQIIRIYDQLLDSKNITNASWVGVGNGSHIATAYALYQPKKVRDLILLGNNGLDGKKIKKIPLLTKENFDEKIEKYFFKIPEIHNFYKDYYLKTINNALKETNGWIDAKKEDNYYENLKDSLSHLQAPTLVLWPNKKKTIDYTLSKQIYNAIPVSKMQTLRNTTMLAYRETPEELANAIDSFINDDKGDYLHNNQDKHKVKSQLYKWISYFGGKRKSKTGLKVHLNTIDEMIKCRIPGGYYGGIKPYEENMISAIAKVPQRFEIKSFSMYLSATGEYVSEMTTVKKPIRKPKPTRQYHETMYIKLKHESGYYLPKLSELKIALTNITDIPPKDLYNGSNQSLHRLESLFNYWLFLMEKSFKKKEHFTKILAKNIDITFGMPLKNVEIEEHNNLDDYLKYHEEGERQLRNSSYTVLSLKTNKIGKYKYEINTKIAWRGVFKKSNELSLQIYQTKLIVKDDILNEYPLIESIKSRALIAPRTLL